MKISVCVTTFNEKTETLNKLLKALKNQTLKPDEIILIDAKDHNNCSRSKGRNIAISNARNEIIAITDVGCIPHNDWLEKLSNPFVNKKNIVVAGGYKMVADDNFQKACSIFLGTQLKNIDNNFMPSSRSMAFTKTVWKKVGYFPEELTNTAEVTLFNIKVLNLGIKIIVCKNALVDWEMPENLCIFVRKIYNYAKGDAESGVWWHPVKKLQTHNIKILTILIRYIIFVFYPPLLILYLFYAFYKASLWGIVLQITSDIAGIIGFSHGILQSSFQRS